MAPGAAYRVSDLELASRLSFFLWSSVPDDELLAVAAKGTLSAPAALERQVRRMLADPRADALVTNFAAQWLYLRELQNAKPDTPEFDGNLRQSFRRETELLFRTIMREDRSVVDLLDADFTFVDERLARHYGIPGIRGSRMRRVDLPPDSPRRGLLGQGSILTVTSAANRTSPVQRGKWVLENVLGAPPPQPPPGVETNIDGDASKAKAVSLRQRMEQHRANAACASCHRLMDPIGFALENFDHAGKWRTSRRPDADRCHRSDDGRHPPRRRRVAAPRARGQAGPVCRRGTEKLLTYALGRALRRRTCRRCAPSRAPRRPAATPSRRSSSASCGRHSSRCAPRPGGADGVAADLQVRQEANVMFITRKHLSRRTVLRGIGASVALPLLDSMVGAQTPARSVAPKTRFAAFYVPHGATMDKWTPATEGAGFEYTEILKPLEQFGDRITVVSGLAHPYVAGAGGADVSAGANHTRAAAVFLTGSVPQRGAQAHLGVSRRPGGGAAHRAGHAAAIAGALDRRGRARLRGQLQLRLSQHDFMEVADAAAADAEQSAAGVREAVRRRRHRGRTPRPPRRTRAACSIR